MPIRQNYQKIKKGRYEKMKKLLCLCCGHYCCVSLRYCDSCGYDLTDIFISQFNNIIEDMQIALYELHLDKEMSSVDYEIESEKFCISYIQEQFHVNQYNANEIYYNLVNILSNEKDINKKGR